MLYKNTKRIDLQDKTCPDAKQARAILEKIKEFANSQGYVRFKIIDGLQTPAMYIPLMAVQRTPEGSNQIRYAQNVIQKGDQIVYSPHNLRRPASFIVDLNSDPELAIFLYGYSTLCANGLNANKHMAAWFQLEDRVSEAKSRSGAKMIIGEATTLILNVIDKGGVPLPVLANFAINKNIRFSGDESEIVIRSKVFDLIEGRNMYKEFLQHPDVVKFKEYSSIIDNLVQRNFIGISPLATGACWRFVVNGHHADLMCKIAFGSDSKGRLIEKMFNDPELLEKMDYLYRLPDVVIPAEKVASYDVRGGSVIGSVASALPDPEQDGEDEDNDIDIDYSDIDGDNNNEFSEIEKEVANMLGENSSVSTTASISTSPSTPPPPPPVKNKGGRPVGSKSKKTTRKPGKK